MEATSSGALDVLIIPRSSDLGGFEVRRALPSARRRMVGPFVFLDQMGPALLGAGEGLDVRPHPHIGLSTVTYLYQGELMHRDSLGTVQPIRPGELNWMTAGRGIVHSERTPEPLRRRGGGLFGMQAWVALPGDQEEAEPGFAHHGEQELPVLEGEGKWVRLIAGSLFGVRSPVRTHSELFYADCRLEPGAELELAAEHEERAAYLAEGEVELEGTHYPAGQLLVFRPGASLRLRALGAARLMLLGGAALEGPRHVWWNFVSSSRERIEQAKADWREGRFPPVPEESEFIPLPGDKPPPVSYP